ncbi:MAG: type II toxin-antitoxin system HicA family toxin [Microcystis sp. Msp_OC_L_20101000_S702]|uniref:type II toxin-antitoxin system HicA family toxin n=1 Tax=Microcystis sp. Msp_OC_L_20101000_S702 TaxID=2486218 RepID=UPI00118EC25B|nr:type II toxin-antitoxin system HicA family toxin [Microcystis sp. Msp_OC_L_20101000_S702]TRU11523.1 MAG: type II toxin-antitoxin system HicA family toxin [Microcystis sp. Msp_OC_L_20101000_S702]
MGKKEKLLEKAKNSPQGLRFSEFESLLNLCGWTFDHQTGSQHIWYSSKRVRLSIQPTKNGEAKAYQVKQFLKIQEEENEPNNRRF